MGCPTPPGGYWTGQTKELMQCQQCQGRGSWATSAPLPWPIAVCWTRRSAPVTHFSSQPVPLFVLLVFFFSTNFRPSTSINKSLWSKISVWEYPSVSSQAGGSNLVYMPSESLVNEGTGARNSVVGWGTTLEAGRSLGQFLMRSLDYSIY
jgi:hypothetical protein